MIVRSIRDAKIALAIVLIGLFGSIALAAGVVLASSPGDYDGTVDITLTNNASSTAIKGPVPVPIHAKNLIDGGFMRSDADDTLFTASDNTKVGGTGQDVTANNANWWWYADLPAGTAAGVRLFTGGPTTTQLFPLGTSSHVTIPDDTTLDITDNLTLEVTLIPEEISTSTTAWAVRKPGAYALGVRNGNEIVGQVAHTADVQTDLLPDGAGDYTNIPIRSGCSANWECVDDVVADDGVTHIDSGSATSSFQYDAYTLQNPGLSATTTIHSVTVYFRVEVPGTAQARPGLRLGGSETLGAVVSGFAYQTKNETLTRPGGGSWSAADLDDLQLVLGLAENGEPLRAKATQVWARISHSEIGTTTVTYSPITAGAETSARLVFDDPLLELFIDGSLVATTTSAGAIASSSQAVQLGGDDWGEPYYGGIGSVRIGDTSTSSPTYHLDLKFIPSHIQSLQTGTSSNGWLWTGTISDTSADLNDATYNITLDTSDLAVDVGALTIAALAAPNPANVDIPDIVGDLAIGVFLTPQPTPTPSPGRETFVQPFNEAAEDSGMPADAWWMLLGILTIGPASAWVYRHIPNDVGINIGTGAAFFVLAVIAGIPPWFNTFDGMWRAGTTAIRKFLRS